MSRKIMILKYRSGKIYQGEVDPQGLPSGWGIMCYTDGRRYEGHFANGKAQGQGTMMFSNGNVYKGEFSGGKMHGHGTMTYYDGTQYAGQWAENAIINDAQAWQWNPDHKNLT